MWRRFLRIYSLENQFRGASLRSTLLIVNQVANPERPFRIRQQRLRKTGTVRACSPESFSPRSHLIAGKQVGMNGGVNAPESDYIGTDVSTSHLCPHCHDFVWNCECHDDEYEEQVWVGRIRVTVRKSRPGYTATDESYRFHGHGATVNNAVEAWKMAYFTVNKK